MGCSHLGLGHNSPHSHTHTCWGLTSEGLLRGGLYEGLHADLRGGLHGGLHEGQHGGQHEGQHEDLHEYFEGLEILGVLGGHHVVMVQEVRYVENMGSEGAQCSMDEGGLHFQAGCEDLGNVESSVGIGLNIVQGTVPVEGNRMDSLVGKVLTHLGQVGFVGLEARMDCIDPGDLGIREGPEGHLDGQEVVEADGHEDRDCRRGKMLDECRGPVAKTDGADDEGAEEVRVGGRVLGDALDETGQRRVTRQTRCLFGLTDCVVGVAVYCGVCGLRGSVSLSERPASVRGSQVLGVAVEGQQGDLLAAPGKDVWSAGLADLLGLLCGGVTLSRTGRFPPSRRRGRIRRRIRAGCA